MSSLSHAQLSPAQYLAEERQSSLRHEYLDGQVLAMTGASEAHNLICTNLVASLHGQLRRKPCRVYQSDMRVAVDQTRFYAYPDVVVVCGQSILSDEYRDTLLNPLLIIEVLSPSTERFDRGEKFRRYRHIDSLQDYLLVSQNQPAVEHYLRDAGSTWKLTDVEGLAASVALTGIGCRLELDEVYEKVNFQE